MKMLVEKILQLFRAPSAVETEDLKQPVVLFGKNSTVRTIDGLMFTSIDGKKHFFTINSDERDAFTRYLKEKIDG